MKAESAEDMFNAVTSRAPKMDVIIKAAAVADYRPKTVAEEKIKKHDGGMSIELERTQDILAYLGAHKPAGSSSAVLRWRPRISLKTRVESSSARTSI